MKYIIAILAIFLTGCQNADNTYVLIRYSTISGGPSTRAYFTGESAVLNGSGCREVMKLANEALAHEAARGLPISEYECVSLADARARGFNSK